jgi:hypothetical protein
MEAKVLASSRSDTGMFVVIDLIGDLDSILAGILATALEHQTTAGDGAEVLVHCKHVAETTPDGIAALARAVGAYERSGRPISLVPGSRKLHLACTAARISCPQVEVLPMSLPQRRVMLARHAPPPAAKKHRKRDAARRHRTI